jgi:hypothetical protein
MDEELKDFLLKRIENDFIRANVTEDDHMRMEIVSKREIVWMWIVAEQQYLADEDPYDDYLRSQVWAFRDVIASIARSYAWHPQFKEEWS